MEYTFTSPQKTVYLSVPYKLVITSSSGIALSDGEATLTASVIDVNTGDEVQVSSSSFKWSRRESPLEFDEVSGKVLEVSSDDLISGSATFICQCNPDSFYWADTATITLSETIKGDPSPYQRQIFKSSVDKPETPDGTAETIPEGWSLQIPARETGETVWVSSAYVVYEEGEAIYSNWSEPTEYTGKDGTSPIVEWQWGTSAKYPPDIAHYTFIYDNKLVVFDNVAFTSNSGTWVRWDIPDQPEGKDFLWKREYDYENGKWNTYLANGPHGLRGNYKGLGYIVVGTNSVVFAGIDNDGKPTKDLIELTIGNTKYNVQADSFTLSGAQEAYYLICPITDNTLQSLKVVYPTVNADGTTSTLEWRDVDSEEVFTSGYVLAEIGMNGDAIRDVTIIEPRSLVAYSKTFFMSLMNSGEMQDVNAFAEALGIERVFERVAAMEAFIHKLFANEIELTYDEMLNIIGSIHSTGYYRGAYEDPEVESGFYLGADGYMELFKVILRDATIVSQTKDGQIIFQSAQMYDGGDFFHTETGVRKYLKDLIPESPSSGTLTISGTTYEYVWQNLAYIYMLNADSGTNTYTSTAPYDCKVQVGLDVGIFKSGSLDYYVNNVKLGSFSSSLGGMYRETIELNRNDVLKLVGTGGSGTAMVLPVEYPSLFGGTEQPGRDSRFLIRRQIGDMKWPFAQRGNNILTGNVDLYFSSSLITNIVYNGQAFDDMDYRLADEAISTFVSSLKEVFDEGIVYSCDTTKSNTLIYKNKTYVVRKFIINNDSATFTTSQSESINVIDDNFATSATLHALDGAGAVHILNIMPASTESDIGTGSNKFRNIWAQNVYADRLSLTNGSYVIHREYHLGDIATIWSDGFCELWMDSIEVGDDTVITKQYISVQGVSITFDHFPLVTYCPVEEYASGSLSGTDNIPHCSIYAKSSEFIISTDFGKKGVDDDLFDSPLINVKIEGFLEDTVFAQIKAAIGA